MYILFLGVKEVLKEQEAISKDLKKQIKELKRLSQNVDPGKNLWDIFCSCFF